MLFGMWQSYKAWLIKLLGLKPYALARSSQTNVRLLFTSLGLLYQLIKCAEAILHHVGCNLPCQDWKKSFHTQQKDGTKLTIIYLLAQICLNIYLPYYLCLTPGKKSFKPNVFSLCYLLFKCFWKVLNRLFPMVWFLKQAGLEIPVRIYYPTTLFLQPLCNYN